MIEIVIPYIENLYQGSFEECVQPVGTFWSRTKKSPPVNVLSPPYHELFSTVYRKGMIQRY